MDLSQYNCAQRAEDGITFTLLDPLGRSFDLPEKKQPTITVAGRDSATYRAAEKSEKAKLSAMTQKKRNLVDMDDLNQQSTNILIKCTLQWTNMEFEKEEVLCTQENKDKYLRDPGYAWILDQIGEKVNDRAQLFLDE